MTPRDDASGGAAEKLRQLRGGLADAGLDGFVVPRADEHQGEYVPASAERLKWLTGFDGSAGIAVVLLYKAALFVDGRYTLQAGHQVDTALFEIRHVTQEPPGKWLAAEAGDGARIGYDPWLHTPGQIETLSKAAAKGGVALVPVGQNSVDAVWADRPPPPPAPFVAHPLDYAGKPSAEKRAEIAEALRADRVDAAVLTLPDSIAWLLNIRGSDVPRTPFPLCFAILRSDGSAALFAAEGKVDAALRDWLGVEIAVEPRDGFAEGLAALAGKRVLADPASAPVWVFDRLEQAQAEIVRAADPCQRPKACKNATELDGARNAHRRDGAALTKFLHWLSVEAPKDGVTELAAAERLRAFRAESNLLRDLSFDTISGAGPNGAVVHYRVTPETDRPLEPGSLYLVDSGGQYPDGTTDVTRTVAIGTPTAEMRENFTRVLKGHIALATARFPEGTTGSQLDALARRPLWDAGLDYDHGTGHGVGSYLSVHEGPQRISKVANTVALEPGMIVSNEPGYYKAGEYGIRIENLVAVVTLSEGADGRPGMLGFETLTLAPIDRTLIDAGMLTPEEIAWLDAYHARVRSEIGPQLDEQGRTWLDAATAPLRD